MNDRWIPPPDATFFFDAPPTQRPDAALPPGTRLGAFELQRVIARGAATIVYLALDHALSMPVAIQEYWPARLAQRGADQALQALEPRHDETIARGRRAFIDESRLLARCDHPALLRVLQLFEGNATAYRVMPHHTGQRLLDLRRQMAEAPDEASLRALLDGLLGALEALHRIGQAHGGVAPANILLLSDDRPLLLGPGAAGRATGNDLVDSLMASLDAASGRADAAVSDEAGPAGDLLALADVMRFCITGEAAPAPGSAQTREPLALAIARRFEPGARPHYSAALLDTLDAAAAPLADERPLGVAQWRQWLDGAGPQRRREAPPEPAAPRLPEPAAAAPSFAAPSSTAPTSAAPFFVAPSSAEPSSAAPSFDRASFAERSLHSASFASPWIEPVDTDDAAPRLAAALKPRRVRRDAAQRRWRLALFGGMLALVGAGALALVAGTWEPMASIRGDGPAALAALAASLLKPAAQTAQAVPSLLPPASMPTAPPAEAIEAAALAPAAAAASIASAPETLAPPAAQPPTEAPAPAAPATTATAATTETTAAAARTTTSAPTAPTARSATSIPTAPAAATTETTAATARTTTSAPTAPTAGTATSIPPATTAPAAITAPTALTASTTTTAMTATTPAPATTPVTAMTAPLATPASPAATALPDPSSPAVETPTRRPLRAARPLANAGAPLAACAGKTEFARYRCAQAQCRSPQWAGHAQCVRLRTRDEIG